MGIYVCICLRVEGLGRFYSSYFDSVYSEYLLCCVGNVGSG